MPNGVGWTIPQQAVPLSGFAHGAAGIAWALSRLAALTSEGAFRRTADAAIAYERTLFDPDIANWRDLRGQKEFSAEAGKSSMTAWCHGATGIGLARLTSGEPLDDERRGEIDTALRTTIREGFGHNHSLCHGDSGNAELLLEAARVLEDERWKREALHIARGIVESISRNEYRCATPFQVESPGLMTGLAGIGYGLLRSAKPERVPSVLTLQPALGTGGDER
jgi:lantibiotic modifying enzyme